MVILAAFVVFGAAAAFGWQAFRSPTPAPAGPVDVIGSTVLWPERTQAELMAAQASVDAADPGTAWRTDPTQVATQFAKQVMDWGPVEGNYMVTIADRSATGSVQAALQKYEIPCPSPPPGTVSTCPPPFEEEILTLDQEATTGPGGIWSVTQVRAQDLRVNLQRGQTVEYGARVSGQLTFPSTASATPNFLSEGGIHIGRGPGCSLDSTNVGLSEGDLILAAAGIPGQNGITGVERCGPTSSGYVWVATSAGEAGELALDPHDSGPQGPRVVLYGLTVVPVLIHIPANDPKPGPASQSVHPTGTTSYVDPSGWTAEYPSTWTATPIAQTSDGLAAGVTIANAPGSLSPSSPHAVVLTVTRAIDQTPSLANDSSFPLSMTDFKAEPGPQDAADLSFQGDGITYFARIVSRSDATQEDVADLQAVIASIRFPSPGENGSALNGLISLGPGARAHEGRGTVWNVGGGRFGVVYVLRGPASTYALDIPPIVYQPRRCAEGLDETWDAATLQIWIRCPTGRDVRYERDGTPVRGNPPGYRRTLRAYPVITAWDGTLLLSPAAMTRSQALHAWGG